MRCSRSVRGSGPGPGRRCRAGRSTATSATTMAWSPAGWMSVVRHSRCISAPSSSATPVAVTAVVRGPVELAVQRAPAGGEPLGERALVGGQHADPEHPRVEHGVVPAGLGLGADEHEQGVERDRGEGVGRHRVVVALGERGEHADPAASRPMACRKRAGSRARRSRCSLGDRPAGRRVEPGVALPAGEAGHDVVGQGIPPLAHHDLRRVARQRPRLHRHDRGVDDACGSRRRRARPATGRGRPPPGRPSPGRRARARPARRGPRRPTTAGSARRTARAPRRPWRPRGRWPRGCARGRGARSRRWRRR